MEGANDYKKKVDSLSGIEIKKLNTKLFVKPITNINYEDKKEHAEGDYMGYRWEGGDRKRTKRQSSCSTCEGNWN